MMYCFPIYMISHEKDSNPHAKDSLRAPLYRATMPTTGFCHTPPYTQQRNPPTHANNIMRDNLLHVLSRHHIAGIFTKGLHILFDDFQTKNICEPLASTAGV